MSDDAGGMHEILDLLRFPLEEPDGVAGLALVQRCRDDLERFGMVDLDGLVRPAAVRRALAEVVPLLEPGHETGAAEASQAGGVRGARRAAGADESGGAGGTGRRDLPGAEPRRQPGQVAPARTGGTTIADERLGDGVLARIYRYPALCAFLARVLGKPWLQPVAGDGLCVVRHGAGEASGWHLDRAEVKVTLLLQAAQFGGILEYASDLRGDAELPDGRSQEARTLMPGTLNLFRGRDTAHRVTQVAGDKARIVAEFVYDDRPVPARSASGRDRRPGRRARSRGAAGSRLRP